MSISDMYILEGRTPKRVSWEEYLAFCNSHPEEGRNSWRRVAWSGTEDGVHVSTVFLTMDHAWDRGTPVLFETMIFGGEHDGDQDRYHTWDEAVAGHKAMCEKASITP